MLLALALDVEWVKRELCNPLVLFGFAGQFVFFMRFAVQWLSSERRGKSHIPVAFWYLSLAGGAMTLVYAVLKPDLVFMTAQALGLLIYIRNLMLIWKRDLRLRARRVRGAAAKAGAAEADEPELGADIDPELEAESAGRAGE